MGRGINKYSPMQIASGIEDYIRTQNMPEPKRAGSRVMLSFGEGINRKEYTLEVVCGKTRASLLFHLEDPQEYVFEVLKDNLVPNNDNGKMSGLKPEEQDGYHCFFDFVDLRKSEIVYGENHIPTVVSVNRIKKIPEKTTLSGEHSGALKLFGEASFNYVIKPFIRSVESYIRRRES